MRRVSFFVACCVRPDVSLAPLASRAIGTGPPIVLVHGDFTNGTLAWTGQVADLGRDFQLIALDRRGFGMSPREPRPYTIADDAADVATLAADCGLSTFHLIGHSYGGLVAIELARTMPDAILSLHLIEPPYLALLPNDLDVQLLIESLRAMTQIDKSGDPERFALAFIVALAGQDAAERTRTRPFWPAIVAEAMRGMDAEWPGAYPAKYARDISIEGPIGVYRGGRSHPGLRAIAGQLARDIAHARLIDIDEAGHDVQRAAVPFNAAFRAVVESRTSPR